MGGVPETITPPELLIKLGITVEEWLGYSRSKRWTLRNPEKMKAAVDSWASRNVDRIRKKNRRYNLLNSYGITPEVYDLLLESQGNSCAICKTSKPTGKWKVFAVDHCHTTGKVRGLLCNECNRGMGLLRDSADLLRQAADYLDRTNEKTAGEKKKRNASKKRT